MRLLLRKWLRAHAARHWRQGVVIAVAVTTGLTLALCSATALVTVFDRGRSLYGGQAQMLLGPVSPTAANGALDAASRLSISADCYCEDIVDLGPRAPAITVRYLPTTGTFSTSSVAASGPLRVGWAMVSPSLSRRLDDPRVLPLPSGNIPIAGTVFDLDDGNAALAVIAVSDPRPSVRSGSCAVLLPTLGDHDQAAIRAAAHGVPLVRSRAVETGTNILNPLTLALACLIALAVASLTRGAASALAVAALGDARSLARVGIVERQIRRRLLVLPATALIAGVLTGVALSWVATPKVSSTVARGMGRPDESVSSIPVSWWIALVAVAGLLSWRAMARSVRLVAAAQHRGYDVNVSPMRARAGERLALPGGMGGYAAGLILLSQADAQHAGLAFAAGVLLALLPVALVRPFLAVASGWRSQSRPSMLAWRDLSRHRRRTAPLLAACILVVVGLSVTWVGYASFLQTDAVAPAVRSDQLVMTARSGLSSSTRSSDLDPTAGLNEAQLGRLAEQFPDAALVPLQRVMAPPPADGSPAARTSAGLLTHIVELGGTDTSRYATSRQTPVFVGTARLCDALQVPYPHGTQLLTGVVSQQSEVRAAGLRDVGWTLVPVPRLNTRAAPSALVSPELAREMGHVEDVGVLVVFPTALNDTQLQAARVFADDEGLFLAAPSSPSAARDLDRFGSWSLGSVTALFLSAAGVFLNTSSRRDERSLRRQGAGRRYLKAVRRWRVVGLAAVTLAGATLSAIPLLSTIALPPSETAVVVPWRLPACLIAGLVMALAAMEFLPIAEPEPTG